MFSLEEKRALPSRSRSLSVHFGRVKARVAPDLSRLQERNPRPYDTRSAAADVGAGFDAQERITEVLDQPLEHLSLLPTRQLARNILEFAQAPH
jgi:hypothetical protein